MDQPRGTLPLTEDDLDEPGLPDPRRLVRPVDLPEAVPHVTGRTWTTDTVCRETPARIARRRAEGCPTVDMEASAFMAVAHSRGARPAQLLLAADSPAGPERSSRGRTSAREARAGSFAVAARAALALSNTPAEAAT